MQLLALGIISTKASHRGCWLLYCSTNLI